MELHVLSKVSSSATENIRDNAPVVFKSQPAMCAESVHRETLELVGPSSFRFLPTAAECASRASTAAKVSGRRFTPEKQRSLSSLELCNSSAQAWAVCEWSEHTSIQTATSAEPHACTLEPCRAHSQPRHARLKGIADGDVDDALVKELDAELSCARCDDDESEPEKTACVAQLPNCSSNDDEKMTSPSKSSLATLARASEDEPVRGTPELWMARMPLASVLEGAA